jgi:hypothetical protein
MREQTGFLEKPFQKNRFPSVFITPMPTKNKAHRWVFRDLLDIKSSPPFPLTDIDSDFSPHDNGSEFINSVLLKWCRDERIQFTSTRAYCKNDNCFVEQKNFSCARNFVGYYHQHRETPLPIFTVPSARC